MPDIPYGPSVDHRTGDHRTGDHRSIESLKKEAKAWLHALRAGSAEARSRFERVLPSGPESPTLRDVQHALARALGFSGWTALQQQLLVERAAAAETVDHYEAKADALLEAYRTGTPEAMARHHRLTWHRRAWSGMRTYVQIGLGHKASDDIEITLDDARWLVAREHGFEDWPSLLRTVSGVRAPALLMTQPMEALAHVHLAHANGDSAEQSLVSVSMSREWSELLRDLQEGDVVGLDAHGGMTDAMLRDLVALPAITTLRLGGSGALTDDGVRLLAQLPHLERLDLSGTAISDDGVRHLAAIPTLRHLSLAWTRVTDAGVGTLGALRALERIDLDGTHTGDGAIAACAGLPLLSHFAGGQLVTDDGLPRLHEFPRFKSWHGGTPEMALTSYDAGPNRLMLRGRITDRGVRALAGLDGLFALNLDDRALALSGEALAPLVGLPHLGWLAFDAGDDAMPHIARMRALRFLGCQDTLASDRGWAALGASQSIEQIWGRRCHGLAAEGFGALSRIPTLERLSVSCLNVPDHALAALPEFPSLRELMPMDIPDAGYRHIAGCAQLDSLVLMYCRDTTDAATEHIVGLPALTRYFASYTQITDRTPELLSTMPSLGHVTFDSCAGLTDAGVAALARLPNLRELGVSGRRLTRAVQSHFAPSVTVRYSL